MHAYIDLKGVVINHNTGRALPLMHLFLRGLIQKGWSLSILTSYSTQKAEYLMRKAGLPTDIPILSSAGTEKGLILSEEVRRFSSGQFMFLDDKPDNLASVRKRCGDSVRVIGFVGSRKYCPQLSEWCFHNEVELALSVPDLFEGLAISCDVRHDLIHLLARWPEGDLSGLIPGLDDPMSSIAGETSFFSHRAVTSQLLSRRRIADFRRLWANIAWITCRECLLKAIVETVIKFLRLERKNVLKTAYEYHEYLNALSEFATNCPEIDWNTAFAQAFDCANEGISQIGVDAEKCRISGRPMHRDRLEFAREKIMKCIPR
jgi:hypothetical protein